MLSLVGAALARVLAGRWVQRPGDGLLLGALSALVVAISGFVLVGLTQSRMALAVASAGLAVQLVTRKRGLRRWRKWRLAGMVVATICVTLAAGATVDRFAPVAADGINRGVVWLHYLALAGQAPVLGYGLGAFAEVNAHTLTAATAPAMWNFGAAHAAPAQVALETGWPGLILLAAVAALVARRVVCLLRAGADPIGQAMVLAALAALMSGLVDIALNVPGIALLASILLGLSWGRALRSTSWRSSGS